MPEGYQFFPRPEAHQMKWENLLPPAKNAVRELLVRLEGSVTSFSRTDKKDTASNCFLVYGERGTGKTTVLLSAREAVHDKNYFDPVLKDNTNPPPS